MSVTYRINQLVRLLTLRGRPKTSAVVLAAGSGSRMNSDTTKQLMELCGKPLFVHSLLAFQKCKYIDEIVLVCRREEREYVKETAKSYGIDKLSRVVVGGKTRQLSALAGFEAISEKADFVAIHDAARACVTADIIADVVAMAHAYGAASAVGKVTDTVKTFDSDGFISSTVDRETVVGAQTPQVFSVSIYRAGAYTALKNKIEVTDDNMLVERLGFRVKAVDCGADNFKVTTIHDIERAEAVLSAKGNKNG